MMPTRGSIVLVAGLTLLACAARAEEFRLDDVASVGALPIEQFRPRTIAFADRSGDNNGETAGIFIRYEDWARAKPLQQQLLSLYPGYAEPNIDIIIDGAKKHYREKLHIYVAEARFVLSRPPATLNLASYATLPFVQQIDPAIKHRSITPAELARPKEPKTVHNQNPQRRWCESRATVICVRSTYKLEGRLPTGIALANKIREGTRKISDTLEFDSELTVLAPAEVEQIGLSKLTGLDTPSIGALGQSIFYVNEVMQFGKLLAVFQQYPRDANKTVATVFMVLAVESNVLGKRKEFAQIPVLRNLVPVQVLAGKSSFNSGKSISAGLPVYARNQVKAIAGILAGD